MSIRKRYTDTGAQAVPGFTCPDYEQSGKGKRCTHYVEGGACYLDSHDHCVEWLKANTTQQTPPASPRPEDDSGFQLTPEPQPPTAATATETEPPKPAWPDYRDIPVVRNVSDEEIEAFRELGVEVCLATENCGEVWIVPTPTGKDRKEITIDHACTLAAICSAFPGSKVSRFDFPTEADSGFPDI